VPDFTGTIAVASTTAAMLFLLAVTLGLISPSPRPVEAGQTIARQN
jgi:cell division protein FtsX